ncbi:hypothetical protein BO99DRAFT_394499 [Aspergillus violaceofuscus CBS 115571]|uniref:Zn(2)-C6 fungal-type domain-containing protein n=1 Tax=Aspergillus violaceofuscus (strain CBS 115571) TaxID=1450538 RepID=A0A2V5HRI1_ASPV1|nr:hypothetical protein BO99DRAFT_394499 [Aspergillus violaceofuscus CBS 115571]
MSGPRTRSHRGCSNCRRSKVKCDEKQPVCTRCFQKGLSCTRDTLTLKWETDYRARGVAFGRTGVWRKDASKKPSQEKKNIPSTADQTILATPVIHPWSFVHADSQSLQQLLDHQDLVLMPARNVHGVSLRPALPTSPLWNHLNQSFLLDYYINQICPRTTPSPGSTSPFAAVILPYCQTASPVVIKALMALAACHWSQQDPRYAVHALKLKSQVVGEFRRRIASDDRGAFLLGPDPEVLVLIMLLCLYEIVDHCDRRWIVHLQGAKDIIRLRRQQPLAQTDALLPLPTAPPRDPISKFVELFFAFQDVMGRTACAKADLFGPSYWSEGDVTINDWMGCSPALVSILFAIMDLSRNRRGLMASASEELTFRARASNLQCRLDNLVQKPAVGREDETLSRVAELKRLTCSVYIRCALHGARPCDPAVKAIVHQILAGLSALVAQGSASQAMMWPLFVAAVELDPLDDVVVGNPSPSIAGENGGRRLVLRLLMEMAKTSVSSVARMRAVIEGVWQRRDFQLHTTEDRKMGRFSDLNDWEVFVVPGSDALSLV